MPRAASNLSWSLEFNLKWDKNHGLLYLIHTNHPPDTEFSLEEACHPEWVRSFLLWANLGEEITGLRTLHSHYPHRNIVREIIIVISVTLFSGWLWATIGHAHTYKWDLQGGKGAIAIFTLQSSALGYVLLQLTHFVTDPLANLADMGSI